MRRKAIFYNRIPVNKCKKDNGHRKSPFEEHNTNNY